MVIVACGDQKTAPKWYAIDVTIAVENMVLAATGEGLGTCWIGSFNKTKVRDLLKIPKNLRVIALVAVGYSSEKESLSTRVLRTVRRRKSLDEIVSSEEYGTAYNKMFT